MLGPKNEEKKVCGGLEAKLHGAFYSKNLKSIFWIFIKILKTIMNLDNVVYCQRIKYELVISCILSCTKKTKSKIVNREQCKIWTL